MNCRDVTAKIDLGEIPSGFFARLRFNLHIWHCTACKYYLVGSAVLRRVIRKLLKNGEKSIDFEKLNQNLVKKFSRDHKIEET